MITYYLLFKRGEANTPVTLSSLRQNMSYSPVASFIIHTYIIEIYDITYTCVVICARNFYS